MFFLLIPWKRMLIFSLRCKFHCMIYAFSIGTGIIDNYKSLSKIKNLLPKCIRFTSHGCLTNLDFSSGGCRGKWKLKVFPNSTNLSLRISCLSVSNHYSQQVLKRVTRWSHQTLSSQEKMQHEFCSVKIVLFNLALLWLLVQSNWKPLPGWQRARVILVHLQWSFQLVHVQFRPLRRASSPPQTTWLFPTRSIDKWRKSDLAIWPGFKDFVLQRECPACRSAR